MRFAMILCAVLFTLGAVLVGATSAATINVTERDIAGDLDILNTGIFVAAEAYSQDAPITINGVTFAVSNYDEISPPQYYVGSSSVTEYSAEMNDLLGNSIFGHDSNGYDMLMSIPTVPGKQYRLQLLQYEPELRTADWVIENTVTHDWAIDGGEILQVDFTATDSACNVLLDYTGRNLETVSGYVLHEIPEPGTLALLAGGLLSLLAYAWRKRR